MSASVGLDVDTSQLRKLEERLRKTSDIRFSDLMDTLAAVMESQTRRRIQDEKTSPDGKAWEPWSRAYAASHHGPDKNHDPHPGQLRSSQGHTLLSLTGGLLDSLQGTGSFDEAEVGSNLVYARRQNADRTFLGLSSDNWEEIMATVDDFLDQRVGLK